MDQAGRLNRTGSRPASHRDAGPRPRGVALDLARTTAEEQIGTGYDLLFEWSDERIYSSELIYKAFEAVGREIGSRETFGELNLSSPEVQRLIDARADGGLDLSEPVVTPVSVLNDAELSPVFTNDPADAGR